MTKSFEVVLSDTPADVANMAFLEYSSSGNAFAPNAGQLREIAKQIKKYINNPVCDYMGCPLKSMENGTVNRFITEKQRLLLGEKNE